MKKMIPLLCVLLVAVAGAGCSPGEGLRILNSQQEQSSERTQVQTPAGNSVNTPNAVLTQKDADAVMALATSKLEAVNGVEDVTPEVIAKLENTVTTKDYVANFVKSNAKTLADDGLPAEPMSISVLKLLQSEAGGKASIAGNTLTIVNPEDTALLKTDIVFKYSGGKWLIDNVVFVEK
jgi:uncharacterized spore protein YtfJ